MKRRIAFLMLVLFTSLFFVGCHKGNPNANQPSREAQKDTQTTSPMPDTGGGAGLPKM